MTPVVGWSALIAGLCILLQADRRFGAFTGQSGHGGLRWRLAFAAYAGCHLALLAGLSLALVGTVHALSVLSPLFSNPLFIYPGVLQFPGASGLGGSLSPLPMAAPLVAALVLIVGVPNLPLARSIERGMRRTFRSLGGVPLSALGLCRMLRRGPIFLPPAVRAEIAARLADQGLPAGPVLAAAPRTLPALWRRCLALEVLLEDFALAHPSFKHRHGRRLELSQADAARLAKLAGLVFDGAAPAREAARDRTLRHLLKRDAKALLAELAELAAVGLVETTPEPQARAAELAAWGFGASDARVVRLKPAAKRSDEAKAGQSVVLPFPTRGCREAAQRLG